MSNTQSQTQNGNSAGTVVRPVGAAAGVPHPTAAPAHAIPTLSMPFQKDAFEIGYQLACAGGHQKSVDSDRKSVEAACRTGAQMMDYSAYDPQSNPADQRAEEAIADVKESREKIREKKDHAGRDAREKQRRKAQLPPAEKPAMPVAVMLLTALLIGLSLTPTFHDRFFFGVDDVPLRWFLAALSAAVVGLTLAVAALRYLHVKDGKNEVGWLNGLLLGALLVAVALGIIRLTTGDLTWPAIYFAVGLTVIEVGVVVIIHFTAKPFRAAFHEYRERTDALAIADSEIAQALEYSSSLEREEAALQAAIDRHLEYVRTRDYCHRHPDRVEAAWVQYGLLGYDNGIAKNRLAGVVP